MGQESIILRLCLQADPGANRQVLKVEEGEQFARGMFAKPVAWDAVLSQQAPPILRDVREGRPHENSQTAGADGENTYKVQLFLLSQ